MNDIPKKLKIALGENLPENSMIVSKDLYDKFMQLPGATDMTMKDLQLTKEPFGIAHKDGSTEVVE